MENILKSHGSLANYQYLMDTIWTIYPEDGSVEVWKDSMNPVLENTKHDYISLYNITKNDVYPPDHSLWDETVSLEAFHKMITEGYSHQTFDMRFCNDHFGFEWHECFIDILVDEEGKPDRILLSSRNVNDFRKSQIIETAVQSEYDYVVYIEASKNSYVMYTSNSTSGTPVPPVASSDYEFEVAEFHRKYVPENERDSLTQKLSIANVTPILQQNGEYTIYCKVTEDGIARDKRMRFSYFDRDKNIWLLTRTDITEIKEERRQKQLLQEALQSATAANRAKSDFLSRMSHDVRTPINAIVGMTAIASLHMDDQKRIADCLKKITISSKLLLNLINEVLDMSKLESGHIMLAEESFRLDELLESLFVMVQSSFETKGQKLLIHTKIKHECLIGDVQRIQQALMNMLTNAIKYTPEGGQIRIEVEEKPSVYNGYARFEIAVSDNGIGMKPEFLHKVFEPFERSDDVSVRNIQGTGLGMSISRHIAQMMNGDIVVESEYGKGSKFTMTFHVKLGGSDEYDKEMLVDLPVLVVDDDDISCEIACENLQELGMKPESVFSGKEAVQKVTEGNNYFAIIIDLMMPVMNGIETTMKIREYVGPDIPIIIISAYDYSGYENEALRAGVNGFISKPIMKSKLFHLMKKFVTDKKEEEQLTIVPADIISFPGKRILVVEDNELNREIAYELLQETKAVVETAVDGQDAVDKVSASPEGYYDLIIMDIQMPVMNGLEATKAIRLLDRKDIKDMPIIAMSANAFAEDVQLSLEAGMNEHIPKPIEIDKLYSVMGKWFH